MTRLYSYAKVNIFLKIIKKEKELHHINSRFKLVKNLYDTIIIEKKESRDDKLSLIGDFGCNLKDNTITRSFNLLLKDNPILEKFRRNYTIKVKKNIPQFAGLGGGSSNSATILNFLNSFYSLEYTLKELTNLSKEIGSDVAFFLSGYESANVSGTGDIISEFKDVPYSVEVFTPKDVKCSTKEIYSKFDELSSYSDDGDLQNLSIMDLVEFKRDYLNDLYTPATTIYTELREYDGFFSGSGSSFFKVKIWN